MRAAARVIPLSTPLEREWLETLQAETSLPRDPAVELTGKLQPLAAMHLALCHLALDPGLTLEQRAALDGIEKAVQEVIQGVPGIQEASFLYEPRGTTVGVKFASGKINSWGNGGMYKLPLPLNARRALGEKFWLPYAPSADPGLET